MVYTKEDLYSIQEDLFNLVKNQQKQDWKNYVEFLNSVDPTYYKLMISDGEFNLLHDLILCYSLRNTNIINPIIEKLVNNGIDINARTIYGDTPLYLAAKCEYIDLMLYLIDWVLIIQSS